MLNLATILRLSDERAIIDALNHSQAMIEFSMDGTILSANENFLRLTGYNLGEIRGQHHRLFVDKAEAASPAYQAFWDSLRAGQFQRADYMRLAKDGTEVWIQATYNPILGRDGKPVRVIKFATDITQQKLQLADCDGQIRAIGKAQAIIEFALDGTILNANGNFLTATGYRLDEIQGKHHRLFVEFAGKRGLPKPERHR